MFLLVLAASLCYDMVCRTQQHHKPETSYLHFWAYLSFCSNFISANCNVKNIPLYPCRKRLGRRRRSFTLIRTRTIKVEYICPLLNWTCNSMPLACLFVFGLILLIFVCYSCCWGKVQRGDDILWGHKARKKEHNVIFLTASASEMVET